LWLLIRATTESFFGRLHLSEHRSAPLEPSISYQIRVRGRVQGVGFRPTVWRLAQELKLSGDVRNDCEGVLIRVAGHPAAIAGFVERMTYEAPPLARIEHIEQQSIAPFSEDKFRIVESVSGDTRTQVCPDAVVCPECAKEVVDPFQRRFRYAFANCTHCGPRLSIITGVPYDRANCTMANFPLCDACRVEYEDPADRRFHAEAIACHTCGPKPSLIRLDGRATSFDQHSMLDELDAVAGLLKKGHIVALKGLGGYQLCCDATNIEAIRRLRAGKQRTSKPFALMARDLDIVRRYCAPTQREERELRSREGPIVLMRASEPRRLPDAVAPGLNTLGFMLPTTPLHLLAMRRIDQPVIMTSGNVSDGPQVIDDDEAMSQLAGIAHFALVHDRRIENRLDDSVMRVVAETPVILRRGRGYAPTPIRMPAGLTLAPALLAMGGELKATFCLVKNGEATLSQHIGDLEDAGTFSEFERTLSLYAEMLAHTPRAIVADRHPEYLSSKLARARAQAERLPLIEVQHHHAHVASCLADNARAFDAPPVLGIVLDGLGYGDNGELWGGEFLLANYLGFERLGTFKPVAMLGGAQAAREPWRNLYAHLMAGMSWAQFEMNFSEMRVHADLAARPRATLDAMIRNGIQAPKASSCGRLFDAVAAALDICRDRQDYEGEAAARLEAIVDDDTMSDDDDTLAYPFTIPNLRGSGLPYIEPIVMWNALLGDLVLKTPPPVIAARFHKGLAKALAAMAQKLARRDSDDGPRFHAVALSGGCFQNAVLFRDVVRRLEAADFVVLAHSQVPASDGGLALGQAVIGAARLAAKAEG
jgi:hydrogenase maturation protein HypF